MKKCEQEIINKEVINAVNAFNSNNNLVTDRVKRLRSCNARVYDIIDMNTGELRYIVLQSYSTLIAFIDTESKVFYDFLRYVYGYTSTSAQHIAKFRHDYRLHYIDYMTYR